MRIDGEWYTCDDDVVRPVIRGSILNAKGTWEPVLFLLDTGADCTVISATVAHVLGFNERKSNRPLGGVGGAAESIEITTQIRLPSDGGRFATFRGDYAAVTGLEMLDMSVLGRDVTNLFPVIADRPGNLVTLIRPPHRYVIQNTG